MRPDQRIVTKIPLTELWDEEAALPGERIRQLDENFVRGFMRTAQVQFIVADCGAKLNWIPLPERFEFWKAIRPQIADPSPTHPSQTVSKSLRYRTQGSGNATYRELAKAC